MKITWSRLFSSVAVALCAAVSACGPMEDELAADDESLVACGAALAVRAVTASSDDGNVAANVLDGDRNTRWSALGKGSTLTVDLGSRQPLCGVSIAWYRGDVRKSTFALSASADGQTFAPLTSETSSGTTTRLRTTLLPVGATGRYVRVTVNGNLENDWASITEVRVRGEATTGGGTGGGTAGGIGGGIGGGAGSAGTAAPVFNGSTAYVEIGDDDAYSQVTHGGLTIEAWVRPDSLSMSHREGSGYVHWMGKGEAGAHEWTTRMYQAGNAESRDNRISFYHFNPSGGLGAGSYFQDPVKVGEWIHVVGTIDQTTLRIYKNGALRDSDLLSGYSIRPQNTSSPLRIGTRDFNSFFQGSVARVAIYSAPLPPARIAAHYAARTGNYDAAVLSESTLVGYWRLNETSGTTAFDATGRHHGSYKGGAVVGGAQFRP